MASQAYLVLPLPKESRSSDHWMDFNFFGHQLVIHLVPKKALQEAAHNNALDGHDVPVPHFGVVLGITEWQALAERLPALHAVRD